VHSVHRHFLCVSVLCGLRGEVGVFFGLRWWVPHVGSARRAVGWRGESASGRKTTSLHLHNFRAQTCAGGRGENWVTLTDRFVATKTGAGRVRVGWRFEAAVFRTRYNELTPVQRVPGGGAVRQRRVVGHRCRGTKKEREERRRKERGKKSSTPSSRCRTYSFQRCWTLPGATGEREVGGVFGGTVENVARTVLPFEPGRRGP
jgi:hypothetical protein